MHLIDPLESRQHLAANTLDTSFGGGDGVTSVTMRAKAYGASTSDVALTDDGKTVIASLYRSRAEMSIARLNADGTPDASFGSGGRVTISLTDGETHGATFKVSVDHSDRVLVLNDRTLFRINSAGRLDSQFDKDGRLVLPILSDAEEVMVDRRDRPVVIGTSPGKTGARATVIRLGVKGALDTGFGGNGAYKTPVPQDETWKQPGRANGVGVRVLSSGQILGVADIQYRWGQYNNEDFNGISAFRLNADGSLDTTYGRSGSNVVLRKAFDVVNASVEFKTILADGGVITENGTATNDIPDPTEEDPRGTHDWSYIDAKGRRKRDGFQLVPASVTIPKYATTEITSAPSDGGLILHFNNAAGFYRLKSDFTLAAVLPAVVGINSSIFTANADRLVVALPDPNVKSKFSVTAIEL